MTELLLLLLNSSNIVTKQAITITITITIHLHKTELVKNIC